VREQYLDREIDRRVDVFLGGRAALSDAERDDAPFVGTDDAIM
jgi:hypothetical protein